MNKVIEADFLPRGRWFFLVTLMQAATAALALHVLDAEF